MNKPLPSLSFEFSHRLSSTHQVEMQWQSQSLSHPSRVGIFGPSGAGKTTLLQSIAGLTTKAEFCLSYQGQDFRNSDLMRHPAVYVGSESPLFEHLSVEQNLALVAKKAHFASRNDFSLEQVIDWCDIKNLLKRYPQSISGGETQRVNFARALVSGKPLLLLDEPFSALDETRRNEMLALLDYMCRQFDRSFIMISHTLTDLALTCDELITIDKGEIVQSGFIDSYLDSMRTKSCQSQTHWSLINVCNAEIDSGTDLVKWEIKKPDDCKSPDRDYVYAKHHSRKNDYTKRGSSDRLIVHANIVSLSKKPLRDTSFVNQLAATITTIHSQTNGYMVETDVHGQSISSFISKASYNKLALDEGQPVWLIFKAL